MELDHIFHPSHKLTYKKSVKKNVEGVVCAACLDDISSKFYSCAECKFFLHKLCAERPLELTHELHSLHPLRLLLQESPYDITANCDSCGLIIEGFIYYSCRKCNFFLHELCAQLPSKLIHELHPEHHLSLLPKHPYTGPADCSSCEKYLKGFVYSCLNCNFNLDLICALPDKLKLNHVCHPEHGLTFEKLVKKADKGVICAACLEEISGPLADYYSCRKCNFFLHQLCSRWPTELISSLHEHSLDLSKGSKKNRCCGCKNLMKGFVYSCSKFCIFSLDFKCVFPKTENRIQNFEELHHHPLIFQPRPGKFSCDLCSSTEGEWDREDQSYSCSICDFWIHKSCALTTLCQRYKGHPHPLSLVQGVPEDLRRYDDLDCDVCHSAVFPKDWVSHCERCRYFVHIRCMITIDTIKDAVDYLDDSIFKYLFKDDGFAYVNWPPKDISSELIQPFLLEKRGIVMDVQLKMPKIRIFSHMQHDMTLFEELAVNNDNFFEEEDEEILCDACIHSITAPYYCCQECNYFLHLACANLPSSINHFSHPDELELQDCTEFYKSFKCNRCHNHCNGWGYWCKTRKFDLICAALPEVIVHAGHEHPLFQERARRDGFKCYACGLTTIDGQNIFRCRLCHFYLHHSCATLSGHIRHRWDRHHPLVLRFPPHADQPGHIMCDMCEDLIHPMRWLYSCIQCDISFHLFCTPRYDIYPKIKYGGKVKISSHHHVLQFLKQATLKRYCDKCEEDFDYGSDVFECETCYACFCYSCVRSECEGIGRVKYWQHI